MLLVLATLLLFTAIVLAGDAVTLPARQRRAMLERALGAKPTAAEEARPGFRERVIAPLGPALARLALRATPGASVESVRARLHAAGSHGVAPHRFLAAKGAAAVGGAFLGLLLGAASGPALAIVTALLLGTIAFMAPEFVLGSRARARRDEIQEALPDALDLMAVSVEAGLGFDAAVSKLAERMEGALIDELSLALSEMRIGRARHVALRSMADRVDAPELGAFVRSVIQADQLGLPLSRALRVQAEDSRRRRQAAAEERAMKAPIKMLFPTVLFVFPAMFLVILGPAMLNLMELL